MLTSAFNEFVPIAIWRKLSPETRYALRVASGKITSSVEKSHDYIFKTSVKNALADMYPNNDPGVESLLARTEEFEARFQLAMERVAKERRPASHFPNLRPVVAIALPSNDIIAKAAVAVYRDKGSLPDDKYKEGAETLGLSWGVVAEKLRRERKTNIRTVTMEYCKNVTVNAMEEADAAIWAIAAMPRHWRMKVTAPEEPKLFSS